MTNSNKELEDDKHELDMFSDEALGIAERFKEAMQDAKTSFPDISGADMWEKLYYAGIIPTVIQFIDKERAAYADKQATKREEEES